MVPQSIRSQSLGPVNVTLGSQVFADMIKLRWKYYLGLSRWALNAITSVLMRDSGRLGTHRRKDGVTWRQKLE